MIDPNQSGVEDLLAAVDSLSGASTTPDILTAALTAAARLFRADNVYVRQNDDPVFVLRSGGFFEPLHLVRGRIAEALWFKMEDAIEANTPLLIADAAAFLQTLDGSARLREAHPDPERHAFPSWQHPIPRVLLWSVSNAVERRFTDPEHLQSAFSCLNTVINSSPLFDTDFI